MFVESLRRFKEEAKELDLSEAYKRACPMYNGRLEHTFIVLKESQTAQCSGANKEPLGAKRPAPDEEHGDSKRKAV